MLNKKTALQKTPELMNTSTFFQIQVALVIRGLEYLRNRKQWKTANLLLLKTQLQFRTKNWVLTNVVSKFNRKWKPTHSEGNLYQF